MLTPDVPFALLQCFILVGGISQLSARDSSSSMYHNTVVPWESDCADNWLSTPVLQTPWDNPSMNGTWSVC